MSYKKEAISELVNELLADGIRVFISKTGEYGFYTNEDGSSLVSFQYDLGGIVFSGNHKALSSYDGKHVGTGWRFESFTSYKSLLEATTPYWVTKGKYKCRPSTLAEHLETYGVSSGYKEL